MEAEDGGERTGDAHLHEAAEQIRELPELQALEVGLFENIKQLVR